LRGSHLQQAERQLPGSRERWKEESTVKAAEGHEIACDQPTATSDAAEGDKGVRDRANTASDATENDRFSWWPSDAAAGRVAVGTTQRPIAMAMLIAVERMYEETHKCARNLARSFMEFVARVLP